MHSLVDWAIARNRMILVFVILSAVAGSVAYVQLPKEGPPSIDVPMLSVSTPMPGASAEDVERLVVKPLEAELGDLGGLNEMTAYALEGRATVLLEFDFGWNKAPTVAATRERVDRARTKFPKDVQETRVLETNLSELPILVVSVSGAAPERTLLRAAKDLQRRIEALPPVLEALAAGQREEVIEILIDPLKLQAYDVTAAELVNVVARNNRLVAAGGLDTMSGRYSISVPGGIETEADVYGLPVVVNGDRVVTLGELAKIRRTFRDSGGEARFNGERAIALQVKKLRGESVIDTVAQVRAEVEQARAQWPEPMRQAVAVDFSLDRSIPVRGMVRQLENSVLTAVLLVMIVLVGALGLRSAALVGLAVPCSFLLTFALFGALGLSVNSMVMFGLILAVGMLVDGAIVVAEYADRRMAEGAAATDAYAEAARRMFWPITSSTATTLCAFLPMLFWPGMSGQFMSHLPTTLIFVLSASLLVALIYLPVVGAAFGVFLAGAGRQFQAPLSWLGPRSAPHSPPPAPGQARPSLFRRGVEAIICNPVGPFLVIALACASLFGAFALYGAYGKGVEFFVKTEPERAIVYVRARGNLSTQQQDRLVREAEDRVRAVPGVASVFAFSGEGGLEVLGGEAPADAVGRIQLELAPWEQRTRRPDPLYGDAIMAEIEARLAGLPGAKAELMQQKDGPARGKPIQLQIATNDRDALAMATAAARARFEAEPGLTNIDDTRPPPGVEWSLEVDRTAAGRFRADMGQVGAMVQLVTRGVTLDTLTPDDSEDEISIIARFPAEARSLDQLDRLMLRTAGGLAPLANFVHREAAPKLHRIARRDGERFFLLRADVGPDMNANEKIAALERWLEDNAASLGGARWAFVGDRAEQEESRAFLGAAFLGALALMFIILLEQFNSLYNSLLVLSAVVMSIGGVLLGLLVMGQSFSVVMTGTGIVALAGIVVNNNIVLIDTFRDYSRRMPPLEAIARTAEDRLRPVLLTTLTTMAGLTPMMFAMSIDFFSRQISVGAPTALWWVHLATAVVFGLGFSTILTLVVTPAALAARIWVSEGLAIAARGSGRRLRKAASRDWARTEEARDRALRQSLPEQPTEIAWTETRAWKRGAPEAPREAAAKPARDPREIAAE